MEKLGKFIVEHRAWLLFAFICCFVTATGVFLAFSKSPYVAVKHTIGKTNTLTVDATKRSIISNGIYVCAEPSPDVGATFATELALNISLRESGQSGDDESNKDNTSGQAKGNFASQSEIEAIFDRTQGIQAIRDGMFRLCESNMNDAISRDFYEAQMTDLTTTLNFIVPLELCLKATLDLDQILGQSSGKNPTAASDAELGTDLFGFFSSCFEQSLGTTQGFVINASNRLSNRRAAEYELKRLQILSSLDGDENGKIDDMDDGVQPIPTISE